MGRCVHIYTARSGLDLQPKIWPRARLGADSRLPDYMILQTGSDRQMASQAQNDSTSLTCTYYPYLKVDLEPWRCILSRVALNADDEFLHVRSKLKQDKRLISPIISWARVKSNYLVRGASAHLCNVFHHLITLWALATHLGSGDSLESPSHSSPSNLKKVSRARTVYLRYLTV